MHLKILVTTLVAGAALLAPGHGHASTNVIFVLDASNSMNAQIDGQPRIVVAKNVLADLLLDMPEDSKIGMLVYGSKVGKDEADACDDIFVMAHPGHDTAEEIAQRVGAVQAKGRTPIAKALEFGRVALMEFEGQDNHVVLISDGLETCDGDPCAAARELAESGIKARVHVVGFAVSEEERQQLECVSELGNGRYFSAASAAELKTAFAEVQKVTAKPKEPPKPEYSVYFEDNFDGHVLADHWDVRNANPSGFVVEDGALLVLMSSDTAFFNDDTLENIFELNKELPKGDWRATIRLLPEVQTYREHYVLALYKNKDNMLAASSTPFVKCCGYVGIVGLAADKLSNSERTGFTTEALTSPELGDFRSGTDTVKPFVDWAAANVRALLLRIEKSGRSYTVSGMIEGDATMADGKQPAWVPLQQLTSLRMPGDAIVMAFRQQVYENANYQVKGDESLVSVDWIRIETLAAAE